MKRKITLLLLILLIITLTACGSTGNQSTEVIENQSTGNISQENSDTENNGDFAGYEGAYNLNDIYIVVETNTITVNGVAYNVKRISTDLFKSKVPVFYFDAQEGEFSLYIEEGELLCDYGQLGEGWMLYQKVDLSSVPSFAGAGASASESDLPFDIVGEYKDYQFYEAPKLTVTKEVGGYVFSHDGFISVPIATYENANGQICFSTEVQTAPTSGDENWEFNINFEQDNDYIYADVSIIDIATNSEDTRRDARLRMEHAEVAHIKYDPIPQALMQDLESEFVNIVFTGDFAGDPGTLTVTEVDDEHCITKIKINNSKGERELAIVAEVPRVSYKNPKNSETIDYVDNVFYAMILEGGQLTGSIFYSPDRKMISMSTSPTGSNSVDKISFVGYKE